MRIAQVSTLATRVGADRSGSVEMLVWSLTRELIRLGHEVTVFGAAGSDVPGQLVETLPGPYGQGGAPDDWELCEWINLCRAIEQSGRFDVLHSHAYLWGMPLRGLSRCPIVHTLHVLPQDDQVRLWRMTPGAMVSAVSRHQWSAFPEFRPAAVIHHGVDPDLFTFRAEPEDYVCYLGRFLPAKGPLHAVHAARALGVRLLFAGPPNDYYRTHVAPLVDGTAVRYVGSVTGAARDRLLGGARALLYPVQSPEPFGLVMIEAMMCGTPVAAVRVGAVPEIIDEGVTGFSGATEELPDLLRRAMALDRIRICSAAHARFAAGRMALEYARLFEQVA